MERPENQLTVAMTAKVYKEDIDRFNALFPMYGAATWFIRTALREFLTKVEASPTMQEHVKDGIAEMLKESFASGVPLDPEPEVSAS